MINSPATRAALDAYARGFTPVPIKPGEKRPSLTAWTTLDYVDAAEVEDVFNREQDPGVGVLLGENSGGLVDIDLDHPKASRLASAVLPETPARSGRPSRPHTHHWYVAADALPASRKILLPDGETLVELRSSGQTVIPPTQAICSCTDTRRGPWCKDGHLQTPERYLWHGDPHETWGGADGPTRLPGLDLHARFLTLALLGTLLDAWPKRGSRHDAFLALAGGLLRYGGVDGETGAVHPLWESQAAPLITILAEATEDEDGGGSRVGETIESTMRSLRSGKRVNGFPTLANLIGQPHAGLAQELARDLESALGYPSRASLRVAEDARLTGSLDDPEPGRDRSSSDESAGSQRASTDSDPLQDRKNGWSHVDLHEYLVDPATGPRTGVLWRNDGVGLLYEGRVNSLYGAPGSAKTWLALHAMVSLLRSGGRALLIDCEDGPSLLVKRLRLLGLDEAVIRERLLYLNPDEPLGSLMVDRWGHPAPNDTGRINEKELRSALDLLQPDMIIVDGTTALYGMHSLSTNDASATDRITSWLRRLTNGGQRTVVLIDHTSKKAGVGDGPTGSGHKIAMVQGIALQVVATTKPRVGHLGSLQLYIGKDRPGLVTEHLEDPHVDDEMIAEVTVNSVTPGEVSISLAPPTPGVVHTDLSRNSRDKLGKFAAMILSALKDHGDWMTRTEIEMACPDKITDYRFKHAIRELSGKIQIDGETKNRRYRITPSG